jgi:hypothetical protein
MSRTALVDATNASDACSKVEAAATSPGVVLSRVGACQRAADGEAEQ